MSDTTGASMLGAVTPLPGSPDEAALDCVPHERLEPYGDKVVRLSVPEFTSLCPVTGQPDFAHIVIDYVPDKLLVESKALKLFMGSFRNHPAFHELTTEMIGSRLYLATRPTWICVSAFWHPRGGIPIDVFYQRGTLPYEVYLPPCDVPQYRGR